MSAANEYRPGGIVHIRRFGGPVERLEYRQAVGMISLGQAEWAEPDDFEEATESPSGATEAGEGTEAPVAAPEAPEAPSEVKKAAPVKKAAAKKSSVSGSAPKGQEAVEGENEPHDLL